MKVKIKPYFNFLTLSLLALIFFLGTASFNLLTQEPGYVKWSSPDETANYFFAKSLSEGQGLSFFDPAALLGDNMVMPRSFRSDSGWLKPVSFLGIILTYGSLGMALGTAAIPFFTPFFAALGIIFFFLLVRRIFNERIALISAFLLASFPVYIYYTVRSMFHNVLFIVLLILAVYLVVVAVGDIRKTKIIFSVKKFFNFQFQRGRWWGLLLAFLAGLFAGLAVITRTSEIIWLFPAAFCAWLFYAKRLGLAKLALLLAGFSAAIIPNIYFNQFLYSAPIYGGYNEMNRSIDDISAAGSGIVRSIFRGEGQLSGYLNSIYQNVFYFGFKPQQSWEMAYHYIWQMFLFLSIFFIIGALIALVINIRRPQKKYLAYFSVLAVLGLILILYYGSWRFNDNPNPDRYTIGNSYTRYWLPIYLMMMPIAAMAIVRISRALTSIFKRLRKSWKEIIASGVQALATLVFVILGIDYVLFGSEEGLAHLYHNNMMDKERIHEVFTLTEKESIIITRYYDKFIFPERRVIMGTITNEEVLVAAGKLVNLYPVYYYNFYLNEADVNYLNERKLPPHKLKIELIKKISRDFGLYRLSAVGIEPIETDVSEGELLAE